MALPYLLVPSLMIGSIYLLAYAVYPLVLRGLYRMGSIRLNYKGNSVPVGAGIMIPVVVLLSFPWSLVDGSTSLYMVQCAALVAISYTGWRDDLLGGAEAKGLKGHFLLWWKKGIWSTAMTKAATGSLIAFGISLFASATAVHFAVNFLMIILFTNFINLLDLRPGRALKGFFFVFVFLFLFFPVIPVSLWLPVCLSAVFLLRLDLKEQLMVGDAGSNGLGLALGLWCAFYASFGYKCLALIALLIIQLYAEKKSLTLLIQRVPLLNWLDMVGRKTTHKPGKPG